MQIPYVVKGIVPPAGSVFLKRRLAERGRLGFGASRPIHVALRRYLTKRNGFFVELGANDGLRQSNTLILEKRLGWRGLLIEPVPHRFFELVSNRSNRNSFACAACVPFEYRDRWVGMSYGDLMTVATDLRVDLGSVDDHMAKAQTFLSARESIVSFGARAATLQDLLDSCSAPSIIDFLSLDVEGAEVEVLRGVNFEKYSFDNILVESRSIENLRSFLDPKGYELIDQVTHHDFFFSSLLQR